MEELENDAFETLWGAIEVAFHVKPNVDDEGFRLWAYGSHGAGVRPFPHHGRLARDLPAAFVGHSIVSLFFWLGLGRDREIT